jgi:cell division septation protein DedD
MLDFFPVSSLPLNTPCTAVPHGYPEPPNHWLAPAARFGVASRAVKAPEVPNGCAAALAVASATAPHVTIPLSKTRPVLEACWDEMVTQLQQTQAAPSMQASGALSFASWCTVPGQHCAEAALSPGIADKQPPFWQTACDTPTLHLHPPPCSLCHDTSMAAPLPLPPASRQHSAC